MDEEELEPQHKISSTEALLIGGVLVIVSLVNLIPVVGDITSPIFAGLMFFYLYAKGLNGTSVVATNAVGYLCGMIPILQEFPTELLAWIITVIIDRSAKLEAAAEVVGQLEGAGAASGAVAGAEGTVAQEAGAAGRAAGAAEGAAGTAEGAAGAGAELGAAEEAGAGTRGRAGAGTEVEGAETETGEMGGESGKTPEEMERERKLRDIFEQGAQRSPEEEAEEAAFNPEDVQFREAPALEEGRQDEDGRDKPEPQRKAA